MRQLIDLMLFDWIRPDLMDYIFLIEKSFREAVIRAISNWYTVFSSTEETNSKKCRGRLRQHGSVMSTLAMNGQKVAKPSSCTERCAQTQCSGPGDGEQCEERSSRSRRAAAEERARRVYSAQQ